jgi:hypothetical protein
LQPSGGSYGSLRPAVVEEQVARVFGRETCFVVIATLSSNRRDASQIAPEQQRAQWRTVTSASAGILDGMDVVAIVIAALIFDLLGALIAGFDRM